MRSSGASLPSRCSTRLAGGPSGRARAPASYPSPHRVARFLSPRQNLMRRCVVRCSRVFAVLIFPLPFPKLEAV